MEPGRHFLGISWRINQLRVIQIWIFSRCVSIVSTLGSRQMLLLTVKLGDGAPSRIQSMTTRPFKCVCILCFEMFTLLLCLLWQLRVKSRTLRFRLVLTDATVKEDTVLKQVKGRGEGGLDCGNLCLWCYHAVFEHQTLYNHAITQLEHI